MKVLCELCGRNEEYDFSRWRCDCGGAWVLVSSQPLSTEEIDTDIKSIWRYNAFFPKEIREIRGSLGAGFTPLLPCTIYSREVQLKLDYLMPTGSFKDRGVELMMNALAAEGVKRVAEDSSGNAGASVAAYAARLGMKASIFTPSHASPMKLAQISFFGAEVHSIPGARSNASQAASQAVKEGIIYASHAYNPIYLLGQQTAAWEVWEQNEYQIPDWVVVPVGQGGNLLGYYEGFQALFKAGLGKKIPKLIAVQPECLAPICDAFKQEWKEWPSISAPQKGSIAEGLAITQPVRWKHIVKAIQASCGLCVKVAEDEIIQAQQLLAEQGFFVEPTSAVVIAALKKILKTEKLERNETVVISLTGSGLKASPTTQQGMNPV
ncbi:MAG: threonine synthase [Anaerolineaceae bacterium]